MASFNRVILLGNLTRDIELRYLASGMAVTDIGLAVNDRRKGQNGEWVEETTFVDITLWGRTAEIAGEYLTKGAPVMIEGRLKLDTWEKDGKKNSKLKVVGEKMQLLGGRGGSGGGQVAVAAEAQPVDQPRARLPKARLRQTTSVIPITAIPNLTSAPVLAAMMFLFQYCFLSGHRHFLKQHFSPRSMQRTTFSADTIPPAVYTLHSFQF